MLAAVMGRSTKTKLAPRRWWSHPYRHSVWALATHPDHDAVLVGSEEPAGSLWVLDRGVARPLGDAPGLLRDAAWAGGSHVVLAVEDRAPGQYQGPLRVVVRDARGVEPDRVVARCDVGAGRTTLTVDRAGEVALVDSGHAMHAIDLRRGDVWLFEGAGGDPVAAVGGALSPDGALALAAHARVGGARLYDVGARRRLMRLPGDATGGVVAAAFAPTGGLAAALTLGPRRLLVWSVPDGALRFARDGASDLPPALAFSPDGSRLAVSERGHALVILDAADGSVVGATKTLDGYAFRLAFSRDGRALYVADGAEVHVVSLGGAAPPDAPVALAPPPRAFASVLAGNGFSYHTGGCVDARGDAWIVGQNGSVLTSRDEGRTWTRIPMRARPYLHGVCACADGALRVYGDKALAAVRDGVVTPEATPGKANLVTMASSPKVTLAASYDKLYRRARDADAWERLDPPALRGGWHHILAVDDEGSFYLASGSLGEGFVARADALGDAWSRLPLAPAAGACWSVACDGARVFVGADRGAVYRSDDRGARWRATTAPGPTEPAVSMVARGEVLYAAFGDGTVHRSDDGGARWSRVLDANIRALVRTPRGRVLAVGDDALFACDDP